jgi:hypothetical protein
VWFPGGDIAVGVACSYEAVFVTLVTGAFASTKTGDIAQDFRMFGGEGVG